MTMAKTEEGREEARRLRNLHALYTKLSGAVLWELFLEVGHTDEECGPLLEAHLAKMEDTISVMKALESGDAVGYVYTAESPTGLCETCAGLVGKKVLNEAGTPYFGTLPPFGVGCPLGCKALMEDDVTLSEADVSGIHYHFCCEHFGHG